jgi:uncharacterized tellurite resistance protein B-like protein
MWRVGDLLAVSPRDRIALRRQIVGADPDKGGT